MTDQMTIDFISTRYRSTDPDTSRVAAKNAISRKSDVERMAIRKAVISVLGGLTAREASAVTGIDYNETQRRISECGLGKTKLRRDGCAVWAAV
jgi:hypothetical protein